MSIYRSKLDMMKPDQYVWINGIYAIVSIANVYCVLSMVFWSLYYRRLVFGRAKARNPDQFDTSGSQLDTIVTRCLLFFWPLNVRGHLFDDVLLVRELVELASQTYQAYSSSLLVSSVWMNQTFAAIILVNCITQVVLGTRRNIGPGRHRFFCTIIDLVLDFIWGILLPAQILFKYVPTFVHNDYSFPASFTYTDTDFTNALLDFKQFFIISNVDGLTTVYPYINMMSSLRNLKILLMCDLENTRASTAFHPTQVVPATADFQSSYEKSKPHRRYKHYIHRAIHALMATVGLGVWIASLHASSLFISNRCDSDCKLQIHPWFENECACSVQEINCLKLRITGEANEIASTLRSLSDQSLNYLVISHCPALSIPTDIRRFPRLLGMQFYNVTLVDWPREASLSLPYFDHLDFVYVVRSRFLNGIPEGLTYELAENVQDLEFVASDIGSIPDDIDEKWPKIMLLFIEKCALHAFPTSLAKMAALADLSLIGNNISVLPDISDSGELRENG